MNAFLVPCCLSLSKFLVKEESYFSQNNQYLGINHPNACMIRRKLAEYAMHFTQEFGLSLISVLNALHLFDRFLSRRQISTDHMQLLMITCVFISSKVHEVNILRLEDLAELAEGCYSAQEIEQMEIVVLKVLDFRVNCVTSLEAVQTFFLAIYDEETSAELRNIKKYSEQLLNLTYYDYDFAFLKPSENAFASIKAAATILKSEFCFEDALKQENLFPIVDIQRVNAIADFLVEESLSDDINRHGHQQSNVDFLSDNDIDEKENQNPNAKKIQAVNHELEKGIQNKTNFVT